MGDSSYGKVATYIRDFCEELTAKEYPGEKAFFESIWNVMDSLIRNWEGIRPEEWPFGRRDRGSIAELQLTGRADELVTPTIIAVVSASLFHVWGTKPEDPDRQIPETIDGYARKFGLRGTHKDVLSQFLPEFLKSIVERIDEIEKPAVGVPEREFSADEVLDPEFEFQDSLEIGWENNRPSVKVNGEEIRSLQTQERLFSILLALAGTKKTSETKEACWIERENLFDPKAQNIGKLRNVFSDVRFRGIPVELRREVIKGWGGKVKLAMMAENILIDSGVCNFVSKHKAVVTGLLDIATIDLTKYSKPAEDYRKLRSRIIYSSDRYENNTGLVLYALKSLGYEPKEEEYFFLVSQRVPIICQELKKKADHLNLGR